MDALVITADAGILSEGVTAAAALAGYAALGEHVMIFVLHTGK